MKKGHTYRERKNEKKEREELNEDGCRALGIAVIKITMKDYKNALKEFYRHPENERAERIVKECAHFFKNSYDLYAMGAEISGLEIKRRIEQKVLKEIENEQRNAEKIQEE